MSLTRSFLKGMGLTEEQVSAIIEEHVASTDSLKEQRDNYKKSADLLPGVQKELDELKEKGDGGWQKKYEDEHSAFEAYKTAQTEKATLAAKETAYKGLLKEIGLSDGITELIAKASASEIKSIEIGDDGKIKDASKITEDIKKSYAEYITKKKTEGAETHNPPGNDGGNAFEKMSLTDKMAYANQHPDAPEVKTWLGK